MLQIVGEKKCLTNKIYYCNVRRHKKAASRTRYIIAMYGDTRRLPHEQDILLQCMEAQEGCLTNKIYYCNVWRHKKAQSCVWRTLVCFPPCSYIGKRTEEAITVERLEDFDGSSFLFVHIGIISIRSCRYKFLFVHIGIHFYSFILV